MRKKTRTRAAATKRSAASKRCSVRKRLVVEGEGIDVEFIRLSTRQAQQIQRRGLSESDFDDLVSESDTESGICHASVYVGGQIVGKFSIDDFKKSNFSKLGGAQSWFLVKELTERGTYSSFVISGRFDPSALKCSPQFFELNGLAFGYLDITYKDRDGRYGNPEPRYGGDWMLISPTGRRSPVNIHED